MSPRTASSRSCSCHPWRSVHAAGPMRSASLSPSMCSRRATRSDSSMRPACRRERACTPAVLCPALKLAVQGCEARLGDFPGKGAPDVDLPPRAKLLGRKLLGTTAQPVRDVAATQAKLATVPVDAPHNQMRVGVIRIVVIDGSPLEAAPSVSLDLREVSGVVRGHDDSELVLLSPPPLVQHFPPHGPS